MLVQTDNDLWRTETDIYLPRIKASTEITEELHDSFNKYWPGCFSSTPNPSDSTSVALQLAVYTSSIFSSSMRVSLEIPCQWEKGLFILIPISTRYVIECCGAIHFSRKILDRLIKDQNIEEEKIRINKLIYGSRIDKNSKVQIPFIGSGFTEIQSTNVMTFIDSLKNTSPELIEDYNFLCEASHPNFIQSMYYQLAGPPSHNWSNDAYKTTGHQILERTVQAFERARILIQADIIHIFENSTNYVNS